MAAILPPEPRVPLLKGDRISPEWQGYFKDLVKPFFEWRHASDYDKIDGGDIYANSIVVGGLASAVTDRMFTDSAAQTRIEAGLIDIIGDGYLQNMLKNGGFESTDGTDAYYWQTAANVSTETSGGNDSNNFLKLTRSTTNASSYHTELDGSTVRYFEVNENETYELTVDIKSSNGSCAANAYLYLYDKDKVYDSDGIQILSKVDTAWTQYSGLYTVASGIKFIAVQFQATTADGWAGFDNVSLKRVDEKAWSWSHSSDRTTIDGGNIYTRTVTGDSISLTSYLAINSNTWQAQGIQLQYNSGTPRMHVGDGSTKKLEFDGTNLIYTGDLYGSTAGNSQIAASDTQQNTSSTSYTKMPNEIQIGRGGSVRVSFDLKTNNASYTAFGKIYVDGVATGTERSTQSTSFQTYTEDLSNLDPSDKIQLYAKIANASYQASVRNFRVKVGNPIQAVALG